MGAARLRPPARPCSLPVCVAVPPVPADSGALPRCPDLHLYTNAMPGLKAGDILGHEFMCVCGGWFGDDCLFVFGGMNC